MKLKRVIVKSKTMLKIVNKFFPVKNQIEDVSWEDLYSWGKQYKGQILIWFEKNEPMAIMFINFWKQLMFISNLEVNKKYKHQGIGLKIMKQIKKQFSSKTIMLLINKHTTLKRFYKHFNIIPLNQKGIYLSQTEELLSSNPDLDYWTVNNYFFYEDDCWRQFRHNNYNNLSYKKVEDFNIFNFK